MDAIEGVATLVRTARAGRSQKEFAEMLGVNQSTLSRYEKGLASPRRDVVDQCMRLVHEARPQDSPTAEQLADRVRIVLAGPQMNQARVALSSLMDVFESGKAGTTRWHAPRTG